VNVQLHNPATSYVRKEVLSLFELGGGVWVSPRAGLDSGEEKNVFAIPGMERDSSVFQTGTC